MPSRRPRPDLAPETVCPQPLSASSAGSSEIEWRKYECELVTAMFGGGVKAREVDVNVPIRASAIRGQLRFWWRLLVQHRDGVRDSAELRRQEIAIWGGLGKTPKASRVWVRVSVTGALPPKLQPFDDSRGSDWHPGLYALFPAQGQSRKKGQAEVPAAALAREGLKWTLSVGLDRTLNDQQRQQVLDALRWWASFGGVGARTRRGAGAVKVTEADGTTLVPPVTPEQAQQAGCMLVFAAGGQSHSKASDAWKQTIARLQQFRQGEGVGRRSGPGRPGRSHWPEADAVRRLANRHHSNHAPKHPIANLWPRAYFGLPIIFHFKDGDDPSDHTLAPEQHERMASPLILRPLPDPATASPAGQSVRWRAAALLLPYTHVQQMTLQVLRGNHPVGGAIAPAQVWPADRKQALDTARRIPPMDAEGEHATDPLRAFMSFFTRRR